MSKRCPDCNWPYIEDTEYTAHLVKGICRLMQGNDMKLKAKSQDEGAKSSNGYLERNM